MMADQISDERSATRTITVEEWQRRNPEYDPKKKRWGKVKTPPRAVPRGMKDR